MVHGRVYREGEGGWLARWAVFGLVLLRSVTSRAMSIVLLLLLVLLLRVMLVPVSVVLWRRERLVVMLLVRPVHFVLVHRPIVVDRVPPSPVMAAVVLLLGLVPCRAAGRVRAVEVLRLTSVPDVAVWVRRAERNILGVLREASLGRVDGLEATMVLGLERGTWSAPGSGSTGKGQCEEDGPDPSGRLERPR